MLPMRLLPELLAHGLAVYFLAPSGVLNLYTISSTSGEAPSEIFISSRRVRDVDFSFTVTHLWGYLSGPSRLPPWRKYV